jgi:hypothetical protein
MTRGDMCKPEPQNIDLGLVIHRPTHPCPCDVPRQLSHSNNAVIYVLPLTNPYLTMTLQQIASTYMEDIHCQGAHMMHV